MVGAAGGINPDVRSEALSAEGDQGVLPEHCRASDSLVWERT